MEFISKGSDSIYTVDIVIESPSQISLPSFHTSDLYHSIAVWLSVVYALHFILYLYINFKGNTQEFYEFDWESNCHFQSDKALICPAGNERLDVSADKWTHDQSWQGGAGDKMPPATGLYFYPASEPERHHSHIPEQHGLRTGKCL